MNVLKSRQTKFETATIERYQRHKCSVAAALVKMYLARVVLRRIEDVTNILQSSKAFPGSISELKKGCRREHCGVVQL